MRRAIHTLAAILVSAVAAAVVFLIMIQGAFRQGFTELDYNDVLRSLVESSTEEDAGELTGFYATVVAALVLVVFHGLVVTRLVRRGWLVQGLALGAVAALVVGLVFCGYADSRLEAPIGLFGVNAGGIAPVAIVLSSLGFGLVASRCYRLMTSAGWWEVHEVDEAAAIESVAELEPAEGSLELAEEGPEDRRMGS